MADGNNLPALASSAPQAIISFEQMGQMAESFAKSNLFGVKTKDAALSLLMIAQAEGIHPALAVMEYDIIEGKPARKAERLLARFQMSGGKVEWLDYSNTVVKGKFSHPHGSTVEIEWSIQDAARVKFWKKDKDGNGRWESLSEKYNWKSWPRAMLRSRVISEGVRTCFPGASLVTLTTEEAQDAQFIEIDAEEEAPTIKDEIPATGFLEGAAAVKIVEDFTAEMNGAQSLGELSEIFNRAMQLKGRISNNRITAFEHIRDGNETRLEKSASKAAHDAKDITLSQAAMLPSFIELKNSLFEQKGRDAVQAWGAKKLSAEILDSLSGEQRDELRGLYKAALHADAAIVNRARELADD